LRGEMRERGLIIEARGVVLDGKLAKIGDLWALVCHPHPAYGGDMENNVVMACCEAFWEKGISTLRFNFRKAHRATGGEEETGPEDVSSALDLLLKVEGCRSEGIILAGYSFGAWAALKAAEKRGEEFLGWIAIAPPLAIWDFSFARNVRGKAMIIAGALDHLCPPEKLDEFFGALEGPKKIHYIEGADHFFWGQEAQLRTIIARELPFFVSGGR